VIAVCRGPAGIGIGNGDRAPDTTDQQTRCEHAHTCSEAKVRQTRHLVTPSERTAPAVEAQLSQGITHAQRSPNQAAKHQYFGTAISAPFDYPYWNQQRGYCTVRSPEGRPVRRLRPKSPRWRAELCAAIGSGGRDRARSAVAGRDFSVCTPDEWANHWS
jgi:hypothetical protein